MATLKRQITDAEKMRVLDQQRRDGILYCFAADHPIDEEGDVEFHHIKPFSESGLSDPANIGAVCKDHHRRDRQETSRLRACGLGAQSRAERT